MSNILTDWRLALQAYLEANLPLPENGKAWDIRAGEHDQVEPVRDRNLLVVFVPSFAPSPDLLFASPPMTIRAWIPKSKQPKPVVPPDPAPLEQLAIDFTTTLQPVRASLLIGRLVFQIAEIQIDQESWGVQVVLSSFTPNPADNGG